MNPGLSKKDRVALHMIKEARKNGDLAAGQPVVELTSGNTGTGLAIVCAVAGHAFHAVMSVGNSRERAAMMRALGASVHLVSCAPVCICIVLHPPLRALVCVTHASRRMCLMVRE